MSSQSITMLGTGLIGHFYTMAIHGLRGRERVHMVYSRTEERARSFASDWSVPRSTTDLAEAIDDPDTGIVIIGLPNNRHEEAVRLAAEAGKAILCTKPLGRTAAEALRMLETAEATGVFHGYLEDLAYTPKTLKSLRAIRDGMIGDVLWARSREAHPGPHSDWFWDKEAAGGGAMVDIACHTIEVIRNFMGKENRPLEVMCWADTLVHPIDAEDHAVALIRFESGALGQFDVSWAFHGGLDLRDEVSGTRGTIMLNHFLRTGFDIFTMSGGSGYLAEKAETAAGWQFPLGDEVHELGYGNMFTDMFDSLEQGTRPMETFYDGYIVNAVLDACYRSASSRSWEPVELEVWRPEKPAPRIEATAARHDGQILIKEERMPDGTVKRILKDPESGEVSQTVSET